MAPTISESARCATIWRMLHWAGAGQKSSSEPAAPVIATATSSAPRLYLSNSSDISLIISPAASSWYLPLWTHRLKACATLIIENIKGMKSKLGLVLICVVCSCTAQRKDLERPARHAARGVRGAVAAGSDYAAEAG